MHSSPSFPNVFIVSFLTVELCRIQEANIGAVLLTQSCELLVQPVPAHSDYCCNVPPFIFQDGPSQNGSLKLVHKLNLYLTAPVSIMKPGRSRVSAD